MTGWWALLVGSGALAAMSGGQVAIALITGAIYDAFIGTIRRDYEPERFTRFLTILSIEFVISAPFVVVAWLTILKG
jgi:hypothetical protein